MTDITIYHNPKCGTSRNTLALIRHLCGEPKIIYYLETPPNKETLQALIAQMGITPRALLRTNVPEYEASGLDNLALSDDEIIDCMLTHPILINRPIVVTDKGVRLCRPSEVVLEILDVALTEPFTKEDGTQILPNHP